MLILKLVAFRRQGMEEERNMKGKVQSEATSATIMYNIKSARQVRYVQNVLERVLIAIDILLYTRSSWASC